MKTIRLMTKNNFAVYAGVHKVVSLLIVNRVMWKSMFVNLRRLFCVSLLHIIIQKCYNKLVECKFRSNSYEHNSILNATQVWCVRSG